ncbi:hypothetical protein HNQ59_002573 [Chitinivorax tropicus]|uniref:Uncharacterized protein n=1 Tax=Chitinivorax tropicus TaxID=714531 RepID=A0A840MP89_9PROT|nr:hypothetical protein [Chitinivorax tropicus]MBB5019275.1 hypothetical protein [Chitinivorax tropicus]
MQIVYRGCRQRDLVGGVWSLFNYGLANYRGTSNVNAIFDNDGYRTQGISCSEDPVVAFAYACSNQNTAMEMAIFAILIDDNVANAGSIQRQASEQNIVAGSVVGKSVAAMREVVLSKVKRSAVLGYYSIRVNGQFYDLGQWTPVEGKVDVQDVSRRTIEYEVAEFKRRNGGQVGSQAILNEVSRLMGH